MELTILDQFPFSLKLKLVWSIRSARMVVIWYFLLKLISANPDLYSIPFLHNFCPCKHYSFRRGFGVTIISSVFINRKYSLRNSS